MHFYRPTLHASVVMRTIIESSLCLPSEHMESCNRKDVKLDLVCTRWLKQEGLVA